MYRAEPYPLGHAGITPLGSTGGGCSDVPWRAPRIRSTMFINSRAPASELPFPRSLTASAGTTYSPLDRRTSSSPSMLAGTLSDIPSPWLDEIPSMTPIRASSPKSLTKARIMGSLSGPPTISACTTSATRCWTSGGGPGGPPIGGPGGGPIPGGPGGGPMGMVSARPPTA